MKLTVEERYGPVVLECFSRSDPDKDPYRVRCKDGLFTCNCKGWIFNRDRPKRCRHTDEAIRVNEANGIASACGNDSASSRARNSVLAMLNVLPDVLRAQASCYIEPMMLALARAKDGQEQAMERIGVVEMAPAVKTVRRIVFDD